MANSTPQSKSWSDRALDRVKLQPPAPPRPTPPAVDQTDWEKSVGAHKINTLTVHDVGLIVLNETQSFTNSDKANDTIGAAREKLAHAVMNGDEQHGSLRPSTANPIEPSAKALKDPRTKAAYESSLKAAREAYLGPTDPTSGATHMKFPPNADRTSQKFNRNSTETIPLKTQSGPFNNSFLKGDVRSGHVYVNAYGNDWIFQKLLDAFRDYDRGFLCVVGGFGFFG